MSTSLLRRIARRARAIARTNGDPVDPLMNPATWESRDQRREAYARLYAAGGVVGTTDGTWFVGSYAAAKTVLADAKTFSSAPEYEFGGILTGTDGKPHAELRRAIAPTFQTPTFPAGDGGGYAAAERVLRTMAAHGERDLMRGFADPFVIGATWGAFGFGPPDVSATQALAWKQALVRSSRIGHAQTDPDVEAYVDGLYAQARTGSLTGAFAALVGVSEVMASPDDFRRVVYTLLIASADTTVQAIGNALWLLCLHPDLADEVRADRSQVRPFVQEAFRLEPANLLLPRRSTCDTVLAGVEVPSGAEVRVVLPCANRDPAVYEAPGNVQLGRAGPAPLTFGYGRHYCMGTRWAEDLVSAAVDAVLDAWPALTTAPESAADIQFEGMWNQQPLRLPMATPPYAS